MRRWLQTTIYAAAMVICVLVVGMATQPAIAEPSIHLTQGPVQTIEQDAQSPSPSDESDNSSSSTVPSETPDTAVESENQNATTNAPSTQPTEPDSAIEDARNERTPETDEGEESGTASTEVTEDAEDTSQEEVQDEYNPANGDTLESTPQQQSENVEDPAQDVVEQIEDVAVTREEAPEVHTAAAPASPATADVSVENVVALARTGSSIAAIVLIIAMLLGASTWALAVSYRVRGQNEPVARHSRWHMQ